MRLVVFLIVIELLISGCSSIVATSGAEATGLALLHDRRNSEAILVDEGIEMQADIERNKHEALRNNTHINVTAYNGMVLVTGEAHNNKLRDQIINQIRKIRGVKLVHNEITLEPNSFLSSRSNDAFITTKVKTALTKIKHIPGFDATRVKVITEKGVVYLLGLLYQKEGKAAIEKARRVEGVKKVVAVFEYID
jgi:osmotically-inducible protein OsmY